MAANAAGSRLKAGIAATGTAVFAIQKNGSQFLTAAVAASGTMATFASGQADFATGGMLRILAPATADATLAGIPITLAATLLPSRGLAPRGGGRPGKPCLLTRLLPQSRR